MKLALPTCRSKAKNAQEAHEAVRPTRPALLPAAVAARLAPRSPLTRLYELIWRRTAASQMADAHIMQACGTRRCCLLGSVKVLHGVGMCISRRLPAQGRLLKRGVGVPGRNHQGGCTCTKTLSRP